MDFFTVCMKHSISALACDHKGVIFLCLNPVWWVYALNVGPLLVFSDFSIPNSAKILLNSGITLLTEVEVVMLTITW